MNREHVVSDEFLNALVDDQLDAAERDFALAAASRDEALAARVCELRGMKQMVRHAYPLPEKGEERRGSWSGRHLPQLRSLAACFMLLMLGGSAGWLVHDFSGGEGQMIHALQALQQNDIATVPSRYVVHVDTANPVRLKMALDEAESLLASYQVANQPARVEIVANGPGLDLLRAGISPYAERIEALEKKYPNLGFMACGQTIRKLRAKGVDVVLLPHTEVTPSALEQIISRRVKQNWAYIKV